MNTHQQIITQLSRILANMMPNYSESFWQAETELFGALPEFDSMSVVTLIGEIEDHFDLVLEDEDIDAENFATLSSLALLISSSLK